MRRKRGAELLRKTAAIFDVPGEALPGETRVTVTGTNRVHIENHRGLLEYGPELVVVNTGGVMVKLTGKMLTVAAMSDVELVVRGRVESVIFME